MVQIVLSLEEKYDKKLRELAKKEFNGEKGSLSTIVEKGIDLFEKEIKMQKAREKLLLLSKQNRKIEFDEFKRNEVYEEIN